MRNSPLGSRRAALRALVLALPAAIAFSPGGAPAAALAPAVATTRADSLYEFDIVRDWLTMPDGVRLAVSYFRPRPRHDGERFPVLFEMIPYRKEDSFYFRDYGIYSYIVRRGFIMAKVDIRGTGSSEGHVPTREYSDAELNDAVTIIDQLSRLPGGNGKIGMWGKSWGGFNSLQVAMRHPPALKAILAMHASDDLYHDDIHFIDGTLHVDPYMMQIDHENGMPRAPAFALDSAYFRDRFNAEPWLFTYLKHDVDSEWWRKGSLRFQMLQLQVPAYFVGGLLDGYKDTPPRVLAEAKVPVKVDIGPYEHSYPDEGPPGPTYEWRERAAQWFGYWLAGRDSAIMREPRFLIFMRRWQPPELTAPNSRGEWRFEDWPNARTTWRALYPDAGHHLAGQPPASAVDALRYDATSGVNGGDWWGDRTGDVGTDDAGALLYDGDPERTAVEIMGMPRVALSVESSAAVADWTVRLEDVAPTGEVTLVTGASANGAQLLSRLAPKRLVPGRRYDATVDLHFTTWTFEPGHRVRLAVTNAQFPIMWPTPTPMVTRLHLGQGGTVLRLPVLTAGPRRIATLPPAVPRQLPPDGHPFPGPTSYRRITTDVLNGTVTYDIGDSSGSVIGDRNYYVTEADRYVADRLHPARSHFVADETHHIVIGPRSLRLHTHMDVQSDSTQLHVQVMRELFENEKPVRTRTWSDSVPRTIH